MDEIVCANTAFRYWRCPPQVRDLYPRLPSSDDGWRALSQAPFVTDILKTPIITTTAPGCVNYHSELRTTIHCVDASGVDSTLETAMGFRVTNPLATLFTMARFVSQADLVLAMCEFCGWFSVFEPTAAAEAELSKADNAVQDSTTESLFELDESQDEAQWKRVYARVKVKEQVNAKGTNVQKKTKEITRFKGTSLWMRKPLIELHELHEYARKMKSRKWGAKFYNAARMVTGIAASPLEVAGILLLSLTMLRSLMRSCEAFAHAWVCVIGAKVRPKGRGKWSCVPTCCAIGWKSVVRQPFSRFMALWAGCPPRRRHKTGLSTTFDPDPSTIPGV